MKTAGQREFERRVRQSRGLAHPASPVDGGQGWSTLCARDGCEQRFVSPTKQRKYCSTLCRRLVEEARTALVERREVLVQYECAEIQCTNQFKPKRVWHRFCSTQCRKRSYRESSDLSSLRCAWCKEPLPPSKTRRRRFCDAICRVRAARAAITPETPISAETPRDLDQS